VWTRPFVLAPLTEVAPGLVLPDGRMVAQVWSELPDPEAGLLERRPDWRGEGGAYSSSSMASVIASSVASSRLN
jgi:hypothetical protein